MLGKTGDDFPFAKGDVVLAKYEKEVYYAKILSLSYMERIALLLFDDESKEEVGFDNIYSVHETTADIICVMCKEDRTDSNDDIVLCDHCSVGYHQRCHKPVIASEVLAPEAPWQCTYCVKGEKNPYVASNPFREKAKSNEMMKFEEQKEMHSWHESGVINNKEEKLRDWKKFEVTNKIGKRFEEKVYTKKEIVDKITPREGSAGNKQKLNHVQSSAFEIVKKVGISSLERENNELNCIHHDMVNNNNANLFEEEANGMKHCDHSDVFNKLFNKAIKVNRVTPWRKSPSDDLVIDLGNNHDTKNNEIGTKSESFYENEDMSNPPERETSSPSTQRCAMDLPRHNWLVERVKQEDQFCDVPETVDNTNNSNISKDEFENDKRSGEDDIKIVKVESLSKQAENNEDHVVLEESEGSLKTQNILPLTLSESAQESDETKRPRHLSQELRDTLQSFAAKSRAQAPTNSSSAADALSIQPKIISDSPSKQYSIPSSTDLALIQYNSLSSFKSSATSNATSPLKNGFRREYASSGTTSQQSMSPKVSVEGLQFEKNPYRDGQNQSRFSLPLVKPTAIRMDNLQNSPNEVFSQQETFNISSQPEAIKRRLEIQKQLENQKKWIDEHDTKLQLQASADRNLAFKTSPGYGRGNINDQYERNQPQMLMSPHAVVQDRGANLSNLSPTSKQKQDIIEERIKLYTKEINELKRQKEFLSSPQMHNPEEEIYRKRSLEMMNDKLRQLETFHRKQTAIMLQRNQQIYANQYSGPTLINGVNTGGVNQILPSQVILNKMSPNQIAINQFTANQIAANQIAANQIAAKQIAAVNQIAANQIVANKMAASQIVAKQIEAAKRAQYADHVVNTSNYPQMASRESQLNFHYTRDSRLTDSERNALREAEIQQNVAKQSTNINSRKINYYDDPESNDNLLLQQLQSKHDEQIPYERYPVRADIERVVDRSLEMDEIKRVRQLHVLKEAKEANMVITPPGSYLYTRDRSNATYQGRSFSEKREKSYTRSDIDSTQKRRANEPVFSGMSKFRRNTPPSIHPRVSPPSQNRMSPTLTRTMSSKQLGMFPLQSSPSYKSHRSPPYLSSAHYSVSSTSIVDRSNFISSPSSVNSYATGEKDRYYNRQNRDASDIRMPHKMSVGAVSEFTHNKRPIKRFCKLCDKNAQFLCSGCRDIWYCSQECQLSHWKVHSKICKKTQ